MIFSYEVKRVRRLEKYIFYQFTQENKLLFNLFFTTLMLILLYVCIFSDPRDSLIFQEKEKSQIHVSTFCCRRQQIKNSDTGRMYWTGQDDLW